MTIITSKIRAGLYQYIDAKGRLWYIEHVSPNLTGHAWNEWTCGTEDDPHADAYPTKWACIEALEGYLQEED